jgi:hypothetical protein
MSTDAFANGYWVAPTQTDISNAIAYANDRIYKEFAEANPDKYTWYPDITTRYPCPEGVECESGKVKFTKKGCLDQSFYPFYDCKRRSVPCNTTDSKKCEICDYTISGKNHTAHGPYRVDPDSVPNFCEPGDSIYPEDSTKSNILCQGDTVDPEPYLMDGKVVECTTDDECRILGVGGVCGITEGLKSYHKCYDDPTSAPYLEWRDELQMWEGLPTDKNVCIYTIPHYRRWCEMPWTRPGGGNEQHDEDFTIPLEKRIQQFWKTKARPPFWYNTDNGECHISKSYCTNSLDAGGFDSGFGVAKKYWMFSNCEYPENHDKEINSEYDCCTSLGQSIEQFFFGRTLTAELKDLIQGGSDNFWGNLGEFLEKTGDGTIAAAFRTLINVFSDPRLKENLRLEIQDHVLPGVSLYSWTWSPEATRLYGLTGHTYGLITPEIAQYYADCVVTDENGYDQFVGTHEYSHEPNYQRIVFALWESLKFAGKRTLITATKPPIPGPGEYVAEVMRGKTIE